MAENTNKHDGSARLKRNFSKMAFRSKEKMLRTFGVGDETKDEIIDNYVHLVNKQQTHFQKFQRDVKIYLQSIIAMKNAADAFYISLREIYDDDWMGKDMLSSLAKTTELLHDDLHARLNTEVITALQDHINLCNDMKVKVGKRGRKLVDFDAARRTLHTLQSSKKTEESKLIKAREQVTQAEETYETLNGNLHNELPDLYDSRLTISTDIISNIANAEKSFFTELSDIRIKLLRVISNLQHAYDNGEYKIQRLHSPVIQSGTLKSQEMSTLPADDVGTKSKSSSHSAGSNERLDKSRTHSESSRQESSHHEVKARREAPVPPSEEKLTITQQTKVKTNDYVNIDVGTGIPSTENEDQASAHITNGHDSTVSDAEQDHEARHDENVEERVVEPQAPTHVAENVVEIPKPSPRVHARGQHVLESSSGKPDSDSPMEPPSPKARSISLVPAEQSKFDNTGIDDVVTDGNNLKSNDMVIEERSTSPELTQSEHAKSLKKRKSWRASGDFGKFFSSLKLSSKKRKEEEFITEQIKSEGSGKKNRKGVTLPRMSKKKEIDEGGIQKSKVTSLETLPTNSEPAFQMMPSQAQLNMEHNETTNDNWTPEMKTEYDKTHETSNEESLVISKEEDNDTSRNVDVSKTDDLTAQNVVSGSSSSNDLAAELGNFTTSVIATGDDCPETFKEQLSSSDNDPVPIMERNDGNEKDSTIYDYAFPEDDLALQEPFAVGPKENSLPTEEEYNATEDNSFHINMNSMKQEAWSSRDSVEFETEDGVAAYDAVERNSANNLNSGITPAFSESNSNEKTDDMSVNIEKAQYNECIDKPVLENKLVTEESALFGVVNVDGNELFHHKTNVNVHSTDMDNSNQLLENNEDCYSFAAPSETEVMSLEYSMNVHEHGVTEEDNFEGMKYLPNHYKDATDKSAETTQLFLTNHMSDDDVKHDAKSSNEEWKELYDFALDVTPKSPDVSSLVVFDSVQEPGDKAHEDVLRMETADVSSQDDLQQTVVSEQSTQNEEQGLEGNTQEEEDIYESMMPQLSSPTIANNAIKSCSESSDEESEELHSGAFDVMTKLSDHMQEAHYKPHKSILKVKTPSVDYSAQNDFQQNVVSEQGTPNEEQGLEGNTQEEEDIYESMMPQLSSPTIANNAIKSCSESSDEESEELHNGAFDVMTKLSDHMQEAHYKPHKSILKVKVPSVDYSAQNAFHQNGIFNDDFQQNVVSEQSTPNEDQGVEDNTQEEGDIYESMLPQFSSPTIANNAIKSCSESSDEEPEELHNGAFDVMTKVSDHMQEAHYKPHKGILKVKAANVDYSSRNAFHQNEILNQGPCGEDQAVVGGALEEELIYDDMIVKSSRLTTTNNAMSELSKNMQEPHDKSHWKREDINLVNYSSHNTFQQNDASKQYPFNEDQAVEVGEQEEESMYESVMAQPMLPTNDVILDQNEENIYDVVLGITPKKHKQTENSSIPVQPGDGNVSSHHSSYKEVHREEILPPHFLYKVVAVYPYKGADDDELSFRKEDVIYVVEFPDPEEQDDGWQMGILQSLWEDTGSTSCMGVFPENFTKKI